MTDIIVDAAMVAANCVKNRPEMPLMKADGMNTAHRVNAIAMSAVETSSIVLWAASRGVKPTGQRVEVNAALVRGFRAGIADHMRHVCGVA